MQFVYTCVRGKIEKKISDRERQREENVHENGKFPSSCVWVLWCLFFFIKRILHPSVIRPDRAVVVWDLENDLEINGNFSRFSIIGQSTDDWWDFPSNENKRLKCLSIKQMSIQFMAEWAEIWRKRVGMLEIVV